MHTHTHTHTYRLEDRIRENHVASCRDKEASSLDAEDRKHYREERESGQHPGAV
jgi:hypothetical protein